MTLPFDDFKAILKEKGLDQLPMNASVPNPGKFEGEPLYVIYFWTLMMHGDGSPAIFDHITATEFEIDSEEKMVWPALEGYNYLYLWTDDQGFIRHEIYINQVESEESDEEDDA